MPHKTRIQPPVTLVSRPVMRPTQGMDQRQTARTREIPKAIHQLGDYAFTCRGGTFDPPTAPPSTIRPATIQAKPEQNRPSAPPDSAPSPVIQCNGVLDTANDYKYTAMGTAGGAYFGGIAGALIGGVGGFVADSISVKWRRQQEQADKKTKDLDQAEHRIYQMLDEIKADPLKKKERNDLMYKLDDLQMDHRAHIDYLHQNNLTLWTPDRDQMGFFERRKFDNAWRSLRSGSGLIKTDRNFETDEGKKDLRAHHAKLLSRGGGRKLLYNLLDLEGPKKGLGTTIRFAPPDTSSPEERREGRMAGETVSREIEPLMMKNQETMVGIMEEEGIHTLLSFDPKKHSWTKPENQTELERLRRENGKLSDEAIRLRKLAKEKLSGAEAGPAQGSEGEGSYKESGQRPGLGAASEIRLRQGLRDSEDLSHDKDTNLIPAPAFITYGHELIHALHNKMGTTATMVENNAYKKGELAPWDDREEHVTIAGGGYGDISENLLRHEHGLTKRKYHTGTTLEEAREKGL